MPFIDIINAVGGQLYTSNSVEITEIGSGAAVSLDVLVGFGESGAYSIDGGEFTSDPGFITEGQSVRMRFVSNWDVPDFDTLQLTVGSETFLWNINTALLDTDVTPDQFDLVDQIDVPENTLVISDPITVSGLVAETPVYIAVEGGEYSIGGTEFTSDTGFVQLGDEVRVRVQASTTPEATVDAILNINSVTDTFSVTTSALPDQTPDAFTIDDIVDQELDALITIGPISITGIDTATPVSFASGEISVNGGDFVAGSATVNNNDSITLQVFTEDTYASTVTESVTVGTFSETFNVSTRAADNTPDQFSFADQIDVALNSLVVSAAITVLGMDDDTFDVVSAPITITNGEYSKNGEPFTSDLGTVEVNDEIVVRVLSASAVSTETVATLDINGVTDTFVVTTFADTQPPVITLTGGDIELIEDSAFIEPGFTAIDDIDGDITSSVVVSGTVDTSVAGTYTLTYSISDNAGNAATPVTRTITVVPVAAPTSVDAHISLMPAADDGYPQVLYSNNTNVVVVKDVVAARTEESLEIEAGNVVIENSQGVTLFGPTDLFTDDSNYLAQIPPSIVASVGAELTMKVTIESVDGSTGYWEVPIEVQERTG